ncbi:MAG: dihydrofolate reductase [Mariniblastus sp.]|nr:dihydrofolate reductase [Mariniblastus sp.]
MKTVSLIVAASENGVIGQAGDLPWRLSADLQRFKQLTMGHAIIMGRKTFESIGRLLPGRTTIIVTRQAGYEFPGALVAGSISEAIEMSASDPSPFITGGAEIYRLALDRVDRIYLTRIHAEVEGDTYLSGIDWGEWKQVESEAHYADDRNQFDFTFEVYARITA